MAVAELTRHVQGTSALWDRFSYNLQIEICAKYAEEQLELACLCIAKPDGGTKCDKEMLQKIQRANNGSVQEFMKAFFEILSLKGDSDSAG